MFVKCNEFQGADIALLPARVQNYLMCVKCFDVYRLVRERGQEEDELVLIISGKRKEPK